MQGVVRALVCVSSILTLSSPGPALGSVLPRLDSAYSLPPEKAAAPLGNCTGKHCHIIHQLNFDENRRIAEIREKILKKIHDKLNPSHVPTTPRLTVERATSAPRQANTQGPIWLFEDIVTFAEQPDQLNLSDDNIVKFKIGNQKAEPRLEVKRADLWILVRMKTPKSSSKRKARHRFLKRRRGKRVHLKISTIKDPNSRTSRDVKGGKVGEILTEVRLRVKKSQWQKFGMPLNLIQTMLDDPAQSLSLRVDCTGCGRKVSPVLLYRDKRKRKSARKGRTRRKRKLSKKRPLLVIHTRVKNDNRSPASWGALHGA